MRHNAVGTPEQPEPWNVPENRIQPLLGGILELSAVESGAVVRATTRPRRKVRRGHQSFGKLFRCFRAENRGEGQESQQKTEWGPAAEAAGGFHGVAGV